jgi:hypothetical protein
MFLLRSAGPAIAAPSRLIRRQPRRNLSWLSGWNTPKAMPPEVVDEALPVAQTAAVPPSTDNTPTSSTTSLEHPTRPTPQQAAPTPPAFSTVNQAEIDHFSRLSSQWWNEKGEFGLLHKMNPTRMEFVRQKIESGRVDDRGWSFETRNEKVQGGEGRWLEGIDVLDVGCGGGLLSEVRSSIRRVIPMLILHRVSQESEATSLESTHHRTISPSRAFTHHKIHSYPSTLIPHLRPANRAPRRRLDRCGINTRVPKSCGKRASSMMLFVRWKCLSMLIPLGNS